MAKPDWGEFEQRFLSEHAATGVSPKEWCKAQELNYATARRYIKKPSAQTAQKEQSGEELVEIKLSAKIKNFIAEYLKDNNVTAAAAAAAARAGYSDPNYGRQLISRKSSAARHSANALLSMNICARLSAAMPPVAPKSFAESISTAVLFLHSLKPLHSRLTSRITVIVRP